MPRLVLAVLLFLSSLLCIFPAPTYWLWYASILVSEFPWIFVLASALLLVRIFNAKGRRSFSAGFCCAALFLFLSPMIRALGVAVSLKSGLQQAFGASRNENSSSPFHPLHMLTGIGRKEASRRTFTYPAANGAPLTLDYYTAAGSSPRPCVIVIHGGSWAGGDSRQLPELNTVLAAHGYQVAAVNYRLAPEYHYPALEEDIIAAISYLRAHSAELHIDTSQFVLLGRSAGAQLALDVAYHTHVPGIRGVISYYGPADMVWGYQHPANPLVLDSKKVMEDFLGGTEAQVPQRYVGSSATYGVTSVTVPTLLIQGKNDPLVAYEHSVRLNDTLAAKSVPHYFLSLPWATHGCDYTLNGPSGQLATYSVLYFLGCVVR